MTDHSRRPAAPRWTRRASGGGAGVALAIGSLAFALLAARPAAAGATTPARATSAQPNPPPPALRYGVVAAPRVVVMSRLTAPPQLSPQGQGPGRLPASPRRAGALDVLTAFDADNYGNEKLEPPDTQVAAGPSEVGEVVNSGFTVWSRTGARLLSVPLSTIWAVPVGFTSGDGRLLYDAMSGRWFLSSFSTACGPEMGPYFGCQGSGSRVYLAVSTGSDPTGTWDVYEVDDASQRLADQPRIGVSSDQLVLSWTDVACAAGVPCNTETWVLQKAALLSGTAVPAAVFTDSESQRFVVAPAQSLSPTDVEYAVYDGTCGASDSTCSLDPPAVGVVAITGTPAQRDVAWGETAAGDPPATPSVTPPPASEPLHLSLDSGYGRLLGAVWRAGVLWTSSDDGCVPRGDTAVRPCFRLVGVSTAGQHRVVADVDLGIAGTSLLYPAVTVDASGRPVVVGSISSPTLGPSVVVMGSTSPNVAGTGAFFWSILRQGGGPYLCERFVCTDGRNRWGDYSGAAVDPDGKDLWVAGEYAAAPAKGQNVSVVWSTEIAEVAVGPAADGYWVIGRAGNVLAAGGAPVLPGFSPGQYGPVVGLASTPDRKGYFAVTADGSVHAGGDAHYAGDLLHLPGGRPPVHVSNIVAIAPTTDGLGYWLVGADGGMFAFGDARYHGSLPGLGVHVSDLAGMVATPSCAGYLLAGADGGVFAFGETHFHGSLPGLGVRVDDIRGILPSPGGTGYVLVGADGGAFVFGTGAPYRGSLPGEHVTVDDIVGIGLTPDGGGYWMAGSNGAVFAFGDAPPAAVSTAVSTAVPIAAIAST